MKWFILIGYILLAFLWAITFGFNRNEILQYDGFGTYFNKVEKVLHSNINDNGDLILCLEGYLGDSKSFRSEKSIFSILIPLSDLKKTRDFRDGKVSLADNSKIIMVTVNAIEKECEFTNKNNKSIPVYEVNLDEREAINEYKYIENFNNNRNKSLIILAFPNYSHKQGLYPQVFDIYIVGQDPDAAGRTYYELYIKDSVIYREVSFWEYTKAFAKDFSFFPVQLFMFLNWH